MLAVDVTFEEIRGDKHEELGRKYVRLLQAENLRLNNKISRGT